jgi:hypothetical protein
MTTHIRRIMFSSLVLVVAAAGLAIPSAAQAQYAQQRPVVQQRIPEGSQTWMQDGWLYVVQGGRWVRTAYSRRYPDPRNYPAIYDIYQNGRFVQRVGAAAPRTTAPRATAQQTANDAIRLQQLIGQLNQLTAAERARVAAQGTGGLYASVLGGFSSSDTFLPGTRVTIGGARTNGEVIYGMTGGNFRSPFLDPNCAGSYLGCR